MTKEEELTNNLHSLAKKWLERAAVCQCAHYEAGNYYEKLFLVLGVLVVVLSAGIGSAEVLVSSAQIAEFGAEKVKAISGVISLFIAILAGLQTFLKFSQKSERHRVSGAKYGDIRRSLEELDLLSSGSLENEKLEIHKIKERIDSLAQESPELPNSIITKHGGTDA